MGTNTDSRRPRVLRAIPLRGAAVWAVCAALLVGLGWGASRCMGPIEDAPRQPTAAEAERLAQVRVEAARAEPVAFTIELPEDRGMWEGRLDWSQPLLHAVARQPGADDEPSLLQAVPGLVATRPGVSDPEELPADGWTVRRMQPQEEPELAIQDILASALLAVPATQQADAAALRQSATWMREGSVDGVATDVFRAPLLLDTSEDTTAASAAASERPEAVMWVDRSARLRRLQLDPGGAGQATVDLLWERDDATAPRPATVLGGKPVEPRELREDEVDAVGGLRTRHLYSGAEVRLHVPVGDDAVVEASGHVDWSRPAMYLTADAPGEGDDGLLLALPGGVATKAADPGDAPPLPVPAEGWNAQRWNDRVESETAGDLDVLLFKLLSLVAPAPESSEAVLENGSWLREDEVGGAEVAVYSYPYGEDADGAASPFRYWVDGDGRLRRVEYHTGRLGVAYADLTPTSPPRQFQVPYGVSAVLAP